MRHQLSKSIRIIWQPEWLNLNNDNRLLQTAKWQIFSWWNHVLSIFWWKIVFQLWSLLRIFIEIYMRLAWHQVVLLEVFIQLSIERVLISPCTKVLAVSEMSIPSQNLVSSGPDNVTIVVIAMQGRVSRTHLSKNVALYTGEAFRSPFERSQEHCKDYSSKKDDSHMYKHKVLMKK